MRKILGTVLALAAVLCLAGCGANQAVDNWRQRCEELQAEVDELQQEREDLMAEIETIRGEAGDPDEAANPIDTFFESASFGESTVEMNVASALWADAWEQETLHLAEEIKAELILEEDRATVDAYIAAAKQQWERMEEMTLYVCADLEVPAADRIGSSGTIRGVLWGGNRARLWEDTFYQLLRVKPDMLGESGYDFIFDSAAAQAALDGGV